MSRGLIRKVSLKKSFKARTTGKLKRQIKGEINPLYGKKGIYNKIYHKTSFSIFDIFKKKKK